MPQYDLTNIKQANDFLFYMFNISLRMIQDAVKKVQQSSPMTQLPLNELLLQAFSVGVMAGISFLTDKEKGINIVGEFESAKGDVMHLPPEINVVHRLAIRKFFDNVQDMVKVIDEQPIKEEEKSTAPRLIVP